MSFTYPLWFHVDSTEKISNIKLRAWLPHDGKENQLLRYPQHLDQSSDINMKSSTSELGVCNASPLSTAISYAGTSHHVAHIMLFIPLVPNTVHDTIIGGADFLVGWLGRK